MVAGNWKDDEPERKEFQRDRKRGAPNGDTVGDRKKDQTDRHRSTLETPALGQRFPRNRMRVGGVSREVTVPSCCTATLPEEHG
ncbi:hypothetical protein NDU88_002341 [Pleurodeles waltl]|uniref:Uncharacterized protein n=1 Tax=Pleurodeles waltl TaxID=8319 RepID=A0AAV7NDE1_PLEWA|nr:hypothetical protein NDU88_002341 [Pleurodeles waltl]